MFCEQCGTRIATLFIFDGDRVFIAAVEGPKSVNASLDPVVSSLQITG